MKKILIYLAIIISFYLYNIWISNANNDYTCVTNLVTWCENINRETSFRSDWKLHWFWTKSNYRVIWNTRVWCPSSIDSSWNLTNQFQNKRWHVWSNWWFNYWYSLISTETCEETKTDSIAPTVSISQSWAKTKNWTFVWYSWNFTNLDWSTTACNSNNWWSHPECTAVYNQITYYTYTATCTDTWFYNNDATNKYWNSWCKINSTSQDIDVWSSYTFRMYDNAWNEWSATQVWWGSVTYWTIVNCLTNNNCYNPSKPTNDWCYDNWDPIWNISYSTNKCTNQNVIVTPNCTSDTWSPKICWCADNYWGSSPITITSNQSDYIWIVDKAWNLKDLPYNVTYIDKTNPQIDFYTENQKASTNNFFVLSANDEELLWCSNDLDYTLTIIWPENKTITWKITKNTIIKPEFSLTKKWTYSFKVEVKDEAWNKSTITRNNYITIYPDDISQTNSSINLITAKDTIYANDVNYYLYNITLKDKFNNPIDWKNIYTNSLEQLWNTIWVNMWAWSKALIIYDNNWTSDSNWIINFKLRSLAPWKFDDKFSFKIYNWDNNYSNITSTSTLTYDLWINSFKKPFKWSLYVTEDWWNTWNWLPILWTLMKYKLVITKQSTLTSFTLENFINEIKVLWNNIIVQNKSIIDPLNQNEITFNARINTTDSTTILNNTPGIKIEYPIINYVLEWKTIRYNLTTNDNWDDNTAVSLVWTEFLWVNVIWTLQWVWKQEITWTNKNFSDLSKSDLRAIIRKNAYENIKNRTNDTIVNWVKYVIWDIHISWDQNYETLIVKDWNVIIDDNLNTSWKTYWIIVIKDTYNTKTDYNKKWNIYIKPIVTKINATIYADWWLISADNTWTPYITDSSSRTSDLNKQLVFNWSIFTRNTIWWAIYAWWSYILPGWSKTTSFDNAMIYDLNYIRRSNKWCEDKNWNWNCKDTWEYNHAFIIKYDSKIQTKAPILFGTK